MTPFKSALVFLLLVFVSLTSHAGIVPYTRGLLKTPDDFSSQVLVNDPSGTFTTEIVPVWTGLGHLDRSKKGMVTLGVNHHFQYFGEYTAEVKIALTTYSTLSASGITDTIILKVSCFPGDSLSYLDKQTYTFNNVEKFDVKLVDVLVNGISQGYLQENLFIQGDVYVDRVYDFTGQLATQVNITSTHLDAPLDLDCDLVPDEFIIAWDPVEGAEEYQLEWVHINDYDTTISGLSVDFRLNSTRISTSQTNYHLSLVFDKGYICYRVRAVGRSIDNESRFIFTPWTTDDGLKSVSSCNYYRQVTPYDVLKNWQYSSTYAEEGKKKEVVSFFDGSLRNRQMVTKINTDKNTIVGETIYDHQGRPAIQVLPVPVAPTLCETPDSTNSLKFYEKFNRKNETEAYTKLDFDVSLPGDSCSAKLQGMHVSSGASNYYSKFNPVSDGIQGYLPDAEDFPFSQVEYTPDNTGRISRQGGVGPGFQLGSGHETKYFYGHPLQEQLDRLFGSEVGYYSHYQKNMVVDPNGQISVSYLDQEGRVIATSLAGKSPGNLIALESAAEAIPMTADLLSPDIHGQSSSNVTGIDGKSKVFNQTILLSSKTTLEIHYDLNVTPFVDTCMSLDSSVCFNCIYDLQIEVRDNCGRLVSPRAVSDRLTGNFELDTANQVIFKTHCTPFDFDTTFVVDSLPVGSYQISKILTVNEDAIEAYVGMYVNDSLNRCKPGYDELLTEQQSLIDNECDEDFSCQECIENLGTLIDYITNGGTEEGYYLEIAACNGPCTPDSYYQTMRELLKGDMMPGGQYAQYSDASGIQVGMYPLSVLNTGNVLPKEPNADWKHPRYDIETTILNHYYNEDGTTISRIYLDNVVIASNQVTSSIPSVAGNANTVDTHVFLDAATNSYYTYPENLANISDFIGYYGANPYWANSLVYYHPEYPILKYYRTHTEQVTPGDRFTSEGFDGAMMQVNTWDDAVAAGFIKSSYASEAVNNRLEDFMTDSTHTVWDPGAFYDPANLLENKVANYITLNGVNYSMMQFAGVLTRCTNLPLGTYPSTACTLWGDDVGIDPVQNETKRDEAWMAFRSLYFSVKQKIYQDIIFDLTLNDPQYYAYNNCIGNTNFNRFANHFFKIIYLPPAYAALLGQYMNEDQPCSKGTWKYYQNKQVRFGTPSNLSDLSPQEVAYQTYLVTGQCPNAAALQSVLGEVAGSGKLDDASFQLNTLNSFAGLLLSINNFDVSTSNQNVNWVQTTINSNLVESVWSEVGNSPFATLRLVKDPLDTLGYNWSQVINFSNLHYTQMNGGNYEFAATATVQIGSNTYSVPVTGATTIRIGNCQFENVCEKNDLGRDLELLFQGVTQADVFDNTTPFNLSTEPNFDLFITDKIANAVSLGSTGNLSWSYDPGIPAFKITNSANSDYLRLGITAFSPSTFSVTNIGLIAEVEQLVVGPNNTFELICNDAFGNYLVTVQCDAVRVTSAMLQSIELGDCGLPTPLLCDSEPYKNMEDLKILLSDVLVNQDSPFDLYQSNEFTYALEAQINAPGDTAFSNFSFTEEGKKMLTFDLPSDCDLTLTYDSISGLNFSFDSIVSVVGMDLTGEFNSFSSYNSFDLTVKVASGGTLHTVVLNGFSCLNLKECISCVVEVPECSFSAAELDSIGLVHLNTGILHFNTSLGNYQAYGNMVDAFNANHGLTPPNPNYVPKISYADFLTQIEPYSLYELGNYMNAFVENVDSYYLLQMPSQFYIYYGTFNSLLLSYTRYSSAVNYYNTQRDGITYDQITPVSFTDFTTTIYADDCSAYITYLLGNITDPGSTLSVLTYPNAGTALIPSDSCFVNYQNYVTAYLSHIEDNPSCEPATYGSTQVLSYYKFQLLNLCCTEEGQNDLTNYLHYLNTNPGCDLAPPSRMNCNTPEEEFNLCSDRFTIHYLDAIDQFNNSAWAIEQNVTISSEYATDSAFIAAGLCECAKPFQGYIIGTYAYANPSDDLPMPMSIADFCLPDTTSKCTEAYQQYLSCVASYNQSAITSESGNLITYIIAPQVFYTENLCNCVDDYCAELGLVSAGLKDFDLMPNLLTFCNCGTPIPCPNDSINIHAEPFIVEFTDPCQEFYEAATSNNAYIAYEEQTQSMMTDISTRYIQHCLTALEHMSMTFDEVEHHFTLYYYDQAGNLIKTVPPEGVEYVDITNLDVKEAILEDRAYNTHQVITNHRMATTYLYNSLNQLVAQNMPDQDEMQVFESTLPNGLPKHLVTTAIQMVNSNQGYLTGYMNNSASPMGTRGYLFSTSNGGQNWSRVTNTIASDLKRVRMLNSNTGFAVGSSGVLLLTADGGASWDLVNTYSSDIQENFVSLELSTTDAYALTRSGKVYKCTSAGVVSPYAAAPSNGSYIVNEFKDFSLQNNYSTATGILYIASLNDGTGNFDAVLLNAGSSSFTLEKVLGADLNALSFYNASEGVTAGVDGNISQLSGANSLDFQQNMNVSGSVGTIDQIHMLNAQIGIARIEENGQKVIRKTTNGGADWLPLSQDYTDANLALIKRSGTSALEVLIQGYASSSAYSKTVLLASNGVVSELNQTPVATQNINLKLVYAFQNASSTTVFGIGADDQLYRSNTYSVPGSTLYFTAVTTAGTISNAKQLLVLKDGSGVSVQVLQTNGALKQTNTVASFASVAGATSLVWLDKITLASTDYVLGYNSGDNKIYGKTAASGTLSGFTTTLTLGTSVISKIAVHGTQLTLVGTNGGVFTSGTISAVPQAVNFYKRQDHRFPRLNTIEKLASNILITGDNGILILRAISTSATTGTVKPVMTVNNLYAANEFVNASVNYYLIGGSNGYLSQFHAATFAKTELYTTSGLTVTTHSLGAAFYDIAVNGQAVYVVGDNGSVYFTPSVASDFFLHAVHLTTGRLMSVAFRGVNKAVAVGDGAALIRYEQHAGTVNDRIFSPKYTDVHFSDGQFGTVIGDHFLVRTTVNGGLSWKINLPGAVQTLNSANIHKLHKVWTRTGANNTHFALIGGTDYMATVSNGTFTGTAFTGHVSDIQFRGESLGGYVSYNNLLKRATLAPAGNSYTLSIGGAAVASSTDSIHAIHVFENQSVAFVGASGLINYYNNYANTSYPLATISGKTFRDVYFHDNVAGYAVGDNGTWYHLSSNSNHSISHDILSGGLSYSQQHITDPEIGTDDDYHIRAIAFNTRTTGVYGGYYINQPSFVEKALVRRVLHEGGMYTARFYYDRLGRIVTSQNSRQLTEQKFSYTLYDGLGRVYEAGEKTENSGGTPKFASIFGTNVGGIMIPGVIDDTKLAEWLKTDSTTTRKEVTRSYYDVTNALIKPALPMSLNEETQRKRIVHVTYEAVYDGVDNTYDHATHYDYDIHGNVKTLLQENKLLAAKANLDQHRFKRMDYTYDLISGNVHRVDYQTGKADQWHHAYNYDADNRITDVYTTKETPLMDIHSSVASLQNEPGINPLWDQEANYEYYAHGPLARTTVGDQEIQGVDYVYTLQGWIKGVNSNGLNQDKDPGRDGNGTSEHKEVARDVFGYSLHYFNGDYTPIVSSNSGFTASQAGSDLLANSSDLYNGNIGRMITTITDPDSREVLPLGNAYRYDQLNRLKQSKSFNNYDAGTNSWGSGGSTMYYNAFAYDANGNIEKQLRQNHAGAVIDSLTYKYHDLAGKRLRNRLYSVKDSESAGSFADDIDDMGIFYAADTAINRDNNYLYDAEGRLAKDLQEAIDTIIWRVDGKVKSILRTPSSGKENVSFDYDAMGHRIAKHTITQGGDKASSTYYVLDAQGNTMSVYDWASSNNGSGGGSVTFAQAEKHIYGSSRLGMNTERIPMLGSQNNTYAMETVDHQIGERLYEFSNHLGNVLSVVSDKLMPVQDEGSHTVTVFEDQFDTPGDLMGWGFNSLPFGTPASPSPAYSLTSSGGKLHLKLSEVDNLFKAVDFITNDPYLAYTITFDITQFSGYSVELFLDGDDNIHELNHVGSYNYSFLPGNTAAANLPSGGIFIQNFISDSVTFDNIKLTYESQPYQYFMADIRQSTDYSPFGVALENRKLEKMVEVCHEVTDTVVTTVLNEDFTSGGSWTAMGAGVITYPSGLMQISTPSGKFLSGAIGGYRTFTADEGSHTVSYGIVVNTCEVLRIPPLSNVPKSIFVYIRDSGGAIIASDTQTVSGSYTFSFNSLSAGTYKIEFYIPSTGPCYFSVDNVVVSVHETETNTVCNSVPGWYRYAFNGMEKDDEIKGKGNSYDFGARMHDPRIGRFLSRDAYTSKFPSQSPYAFAGNTPIMATDINGDSLYILTYVSGYERGDDMFKAAAITRQYDIEHSKGFDPKRDKVVLLEVTDLGKIESQVTKAVKENSKTYGATVEFGIWSHSALEGPTGSANTSGPDAITPNQMTPEGWGKIDFNWSSGSGNRASFYGCRGGMPKEDGSMSFTRELSSLNNFKDVLVGGQSNYSFPSKYSDYRSPSFAQIFGEFLPVEYTPMAKEATTVIRKTYMVASPKENLSSEKASLWGIPASKMNFSKNGKFIYSGYQKGDKE